MWTDRVYYQRRQSAGQRRAPGVSARRIDSDEGCASAEGFHLLEEALRSDARSRWCWSRSRREARCAETGARTVILPDKLFQTIAATETSQGVIALVRPPEWSLDELFLVQRGPEHGGCARWIAGSRATPARSCARQKRSGPPA